jgi:hypothetical protein
MHLIAAYVRAFYLHDLEYSYFLPLTKNQAPPAMIIAVQDDELDNYGEEFDSPPPYSPVSAIAPPTLPSSI